MNGRTEYSSGPGIPRLIHVVWVGDENKCPHSLIESWALLNPTCKLKIWGNNNLAINQWFKAKHINRLMEKMV